MHSSAFSFEKPLIWLQTSPFLLLKGKITTQIRFPDVGRESLVIFWVRGRLCLDKLTFKLNERNWKWNNRKLLSNSLSLCDRWLKLRRLTYTWRFLMERCKINELLYHWRWSFFKKVGSEFALSPPSLYIPSPSSTPSFDVFLARAGEVCLVALQVWLECFQLHFENLFCCIAKKCLILLLP